MNTLAPAVQVLTSLIAVLALGLTASLLGAWLLRTVAFSSLYERIAVTTLTGLGVFAVTVFALGLIGAVWTPLFALALVIGVVSSWQRLRAGVAILWQRLRALSWTEQVFLTVVAIMLLLLLMLALRPPTAFDATTYHLAYVRRYAATHHITPVENLRYPVFPQLNEMLFTVVWLLGGDPAPALVEALFTLLTALCLVAWGQRLGSVRVGLWAAALWLGNPIVVFLGTAPYNYRVCGCCTSLPQQTWRRRSSSMVCSDPGHPMLVI